MSPRENLGVLEEITEIYKQRIDGLLDEWRSIRGRWKRLGQASDERLLPPIEGSVAEEIDDYFRAAQQSLHTVEGSLVGDFRNMPLCEQNLFEINKQMAEIARMLFLLKMATSQRTVSLELPYVIAGLPMSMEREIGNEAFLLAADNTIHNYLSQIRLYDLQWDRFASYYPIFLEDEVFPGATYIRMFKKTFHIALSHDIRYFLQGYLALAHEVGHAASEARYMLDEDKDALIPLILARYLVQFYQFRRDMLKRIETRKPNNRCRKCGYSEELERLCNSESLETFIKEVAINISAPNFAAAVDQIMADIIAIQIAGPHYISVLFNYSIDYFVLQDGVAQLSDLFQHLIIRTNACAAFACDQALPWSHQCLSLCERIANTALDSINSMESLYTWKGKSRDLKSDYIRCLECCSEFGLILGLVASSGFETLHDGVFHSKSLFSIDLNLLDKLMKGETVTDAEPREILHAYYDLLLDEKKRDSSTVLYSLSHNKLHSR